MTSIAVAQALLLPLVERGEALLQIPEDQWFERKSSRIKPDGLANAEIGFANAEGGAIAIGLHNGRIEGVDSVEPGRLNGLRQAALDLTVPTVPVRARMVDCINARGERDHLLFLDVETDDHLHQNTRDEVYLRVGDENRKLTFTQRQELLYDKGQATYESTVVADASVDDLDEAILGGYADAMAHPDPYRLLQARGLITHDRKVTVGAILLFGENPQIQFPEAQVRVTRYRGTERGAGARQQLVHDTRFEGPIPEVLDNVQKEIYEQLPTRRALSGDGRFESVGMVPRDAWLEGLVNAVIHRSYSLMGDHIRVEIFDDRLEIESPGRFPGIVDPTDPTSVTRFARNPRIARVCADLRFGQELGEGIRRIYEEMRLAGLADPEYRQTAGSVRLTLLSTLVDRELESRLPPGGRALVRLIRESERPSTGDLVAATGLSRPVVISRLNSLRELGLIEWVGRSRNDPRAYWRLAS